MPAALVDSVVLVDFRDEDAGDRHSRARDVVGGIDGGDLPTGRVTDYVLLETMNWLHERGAPGLARDTYARLRDSAGFEVVHTAQKDFYTALDVFDAYDRLSFGDATTVAYMWRADLDYVYSFDDDFDGVDGVTRLATAEDPFGA